MSTIQLTNEIKLVEPNNGSTLLNTSILLKREIVAPNRSGEDRYSEGLDIQTFDAYGYQLELSIQRYRKPGASEPSDKWKVSAYRHPFRPPTETLINPRVARRLINRLIVLTEEYPTLLWNPTNNRYAQHDGFVKFINRLLHGETPSVVLLP